MPQNLQTVSSRAIFCSSSGSGCSGTCSTDAITCESTRVCSRHVGKQDEKYIFIGHTHIYIIIIIYLYCRHTVHIHIKKMLNIYKNSNKNNNNIISQSKIVLINITLISTIAEWESEHKQ